MNKLNKRTIDKINKINNDRKEILNQIKEGILEGNEKIIDNLDTILSSFNDSEKDCKEYISILKVREMINKLINDIVNAESLEDISKIRNKLNYQIKKVKDTLTKRDIPEETMAEYTHKIKTTKSWITEYVRSMKRTSNIDSILDLMKQEYSEENKKTILKLSKSEDKYNKRVKNRNFTNEIEAFNKKQAEENVYIAEYDGLRFNAKQEELVKEDEPIVEVVEETPNKSVTIVEQKVEEINTVKEIKTEEPIINVLKDQIRFEDQINVEITAPIKKSENEPKKAIIEEPEDQEKIKRRYGFLEIPKVQGNTFASIIGLLKNLSYYSYDKRIIKKMQRDLAINPNGSLELAVASATEEASIKNALKKIFSQNKISKRSKELEGKLSKSPLTAIDKKHQQKIYKNAHN